MRNHYHVVAFINGCLNDYDSGPISNKRDANRACREYVKDGGQQPGLACHGSLQTNGLLRFVQGSYIIKVEDCNQDCTTDDLF